MYNQTANKALDRSEFTKQRTIPAGIKMYRTTASSGKEKDGLTYVSYLDVDRNHYKAGWIRQTAKSDKAYEREYVLTKDLKIPSRQEVKGVINDVVIKNKRLLTESVQKWVDMLTPEGSWNRYYIDESPGGVKKYVDDMIDNLSKQSINESYFTIAQSLGLATNVKNAVVKELSKRGYNAMVDEASIGGKKGFAREGVDPLILFDSTVLNQVSQKEISRASENKAARKFTKWVGKASRNSKKGQWSESSLNSIRMVTDMDNYSNNDFLAHYGVRGMKWGVRRDIKKRSRLGAQAGKMADAYQKAADRFKSKGVTKGDKRYTAMRKAQNKARQLQKAQKSLYKGLSQRDIDRGRKSINRFINSGLIDELRRQNDVKYYMRKGKY